jgi:hypothetical protein
VPFAATVGCPTVGATDGERVAPGEALGVVVLPAADVAVAAIVGDTDDGVTVGAVVGPMFGVGVAVGLA